jgi:hypothetical protein
MNNNTLLSSLHVVQTVSDNPRLPQHGHFHKTFITALDLAVVYILSRHPSF